MLFNSMLEIEYADIGMIFTLASFNRTDLIVNYSFHIGSLCFSIMKG